MNTEKYLDGPLREYAETLLNNGFKILVKERTPKATWFHFMKNGKIGYVQYDKSYGFNFSSVHKPSAEYGTGFSVYREIGYTPTVEMATRTCLTITPIWGESSKVRKYQTDDEFIQHERKFFNDIVILEK